MSDWRKITPIAVMCALGVWLAGCQRPAEAPPTIVSPLSAGTPVSMILLQEMESGEIPEGAPVSLLVNEDVKDASGHVLITRGTPAQGEVTWSRKEEMLGGLTNRPARLKFRILATSAVDGTAVTLCADKDRPEEPYELNRANTGRGPAADKVDELMKDDQNRAVLEAMKDLASDQTRDVSAALESVESRDRLAKIGQELGVPSLSALAQQGEVGKVKEALSKLRSPSTNANTSEPFSRYALKNLPMVDTVLAITNVASQVNHGLDALRHGRNIKAYVGTSINGFVASETTVKVQP